MDKINHYKALIKRKKHYLSKRQENLLHFSKLAPEKFWWQILTCKANEDNKIALKDWNSYLKRIYESPYIIDNIQTLLTMKAIF